MLGIADDVVAGGFRMGPLKEARLLEPLAMAWIVLARHRGLGRDFALNIIRRPTTGGVVGVPTWYIFDNTALGAATANGLDLLERFRDRSE